ncbi:MAG: hypothetical protein KGI45_03195 [Patescibacteria group bacterium]|nr:hypothetical protein [Patescibacteria group bacterium]MDE1941021.1 hypothetical protein [Patescibacteria group bacterium]MDE1967050.1 hypothetical protein [Patescibacteria group bacterium]
MNGTFFDFSLRQRVNQWLGIALISLMCFWVVLYYLVNRSEAIASNLVSSDQTF